MTAINRAIKTGMAVLPLGVWRLAHALYPQAVAAKSLYCVAFFGHGRPRDLDHLETTSSIWRGTVRRALRDYIASPYLRGLVA